MHTPLISGTPDSNTQIEILADSEKIQIKHTQITNTRDIDIKIQENDYGTKKLTATATSNSIEKVTLLKRSHTGQIVGGVVGGVGGAIVAMLLIGLVLYFYRRRRNHTKDTDTVDLEKNSKPVNNALKSQSQIELIEKEDSIEYTYDNEYSVEKTFSKISQLPSNPGYILSVSFDNETDVENTIYSDSTNSSDSDFTFQTGKESMSMGAPTKAFFTEKF